MVDKTTVTAETFVDNCTSDEHCEFNEAQCEQLWDIWTAFTDEHTDRLLVLIDDWVSLDDLDRRRPVLLARVEYDNEDKGAVLFSDVRPIDVGTIENQQLVQSDFDIDDIIETVDLTDSEHYDEAGLMWVPRTSMSVYER